jgi:hypothetical protein
MGWKTDWLYVLVFDLVRDLWNSMSRFAEQMTERNGSQPSQPPLDALLVYQCGEADLSRASCRKPILREWVFDGEAFTERDSEEMADPINPHQKRSSHHFAVLLAGLPKPLEVRGALFVQGMVCFYITADRKHVLFTYQIGPRFGRGSLYSVEGQGQSGRLTLERDAAGWVS